MRPFKGLVACFVFHQSIYANHVQMHVAIDLVYGQNVLHNEND